MDGGKSGRNRSLSKKQPFHCNKLQIQTKDKKYLEESSQCFITKISLRCVATVTGIKMEYFTTMCVKDGGLHCQKIDTNFSYHVSFENSILHM
jgi:hypothetical protein